MFKRNPDWQLIAAISAMLGFALQLAAILLIDKSVQRASLVPIATTTITIAGAVIVALIIEGYKRRLDERQSREVIRDTFVELDKAMAQVLEPLPEEGDIDERKFPLILALESLGAAADLLKILRRDQKITDVTLWRQLRGMEAEIESRRSMLDSELAILSGNRVSDRVLEIAYEKTASAANLLRPGVIAMIRGLTP